MSKEINILKEFLYVYDNRLQENEPTHREIVEAYEKVIEDNHKYFGQLEEQVLQPQHITAEEIVKELNEFYGVDDYATVWDLLYKNHTKEVADREVRPHHKLMLWRNAHYATAYKNLKGNLIQLYSQDKRIEGFNGLPLKLAHKITTFFMEVNNEIK